MSLKVGDIVEMEKWDEKTGEFVKKQFKVTSIDTLPGGGKVIGYQEVEDNGA